MEITPAAAQPGLSETTQAPLDRVRLTTIGLAIGFGAPFVVGIALLAADFAGWQWPTVFALTRIAAAIIASGAIIVIVRRFEGWRLATVGIRPLEILDLTLGMAVGAGLLAASMFTALIFGRGDHGAGSWLGGIILAIRPNEISVLSNAPVWLGIAAVIVLSFSDELIARGYAIQRMSAVAGSIWLGVGGAVALDLIAHLALWGLGSSLCFVPAEVALAYVYSQRRRLWPCVVARMIFGLVALASVGIATGTAVSGDVHKGARNAFGNDSERAIGKLNQALRANLGAVALPANPKTASEFAHRAQAYWANGQRDKAIADMTTAISLDPKDREYLELRAGMYGLSGNGGEDASAIADYDRMLALDPKDTEALQQRALEKYTMRDPAGAMADMNAAIKIGPKDPANYLARANLYFEEGNNARTSADIETALLLDPNNIKTIQMRATYYLRTGQLDKAIADASRIIALMPESTLGYRIRETAYDSKGDWNDAIADISEIIRREPGNADAYANRAGLEVDTGQTHLARQDFEHVAQLNPDSLDDLDQAAWAMSTSMHPEIRDGKTAVVLATKACRLSGWNDSTHLVTLAAAYAETGDFAQAVTYQAKAMEAPFGNHDADQMALMRQQLELYNRHQPYREGDFARRRMSNAKYMLGVTLLLLILVGLATLAIGVIKLARYRAPQRA